MEFDCTHVKCFIHIKTSIGAPKPLVLGSMESMQLNSQDSWVEAQRVMDLETLPFNVGVTSGSK